MSKVLAVAVILLFLGVGFQPVLANEISDVDEDCLNCQPMSRVDDVRIKQLFTRLEVVINVILSKIGQIPEIVDACEEILGMLKNGIKDIICDILLNPLWKLREFFFELFLNQGRNLKLFIYGSFLLIVHYIMMVIIYGLNCKNWEPPDEQQSSIILGSLLHRNSFYN